MKRVRHRVQRDAGFSLAEMLVVFAVLGLVTGLAGLALEPARRNRQLAGAVLSLTKLAAMARDGAIRSGVSHHLIFGPSERTVLIPELGRQMRLPGEVTLALTTAVEIAASDQPSILFLPDGTGSGGRVTVTLGERSQTVHVSWLTGAITNGP